MKDKTVLISKDALGCFYLPTYGNKYFKTPNIDELAEKGTVFHRHYTAAPSTAMSFIAMSTGLFPYQTEHRDYRVLEKQYENTIYDKLWDNGYASHIIWDSKWIPMAKVYSECYGKNTNIHLIDNLRQPVGYHSDHKGKLHENLELAEQTMKKFEEEYKG